MIPIKEDELKQRQANKPESLNSGYTIGGEPLLLPSGAISIFTALPLLLCYPVAPEPYLSLLYPVAE